MTENPKVTCIEDTREFLDTLSEWLSMDEGTATEFPDGQVDVRINGVLHDAEITQIREDGKGRLSIVLWVIRSEGSPSVERDKYAGVLLPDGLETDESAVISAPDVRVYTGIQRDEVFVREMQRMIQVYEY